MLFVHQDPEGSWKGLQDLGMFGTYQNLCSKRTDRSLGSMRVNPAPPSLPVPACGSS